jgi:hypothetical protein
MNKHLFCSFEKQTEKSCYRLSILAGTSYEDAITACQEFIVALQEDMALEIARRELAEKKTEENMPAELQKSQSEPYDQDHNPVTGQTTE